MRNILRGGLVLLATILTACGGDSDGPTGPDTSHVGTYTLSTLNGTNLPFVLVQVGNDKLEITQGSMTLNADNTFSDRATLRETVGGAVSTEQSTSTGTYSRNNNALSFTYSDGSVIAGSLSGGQLTIAQDGVVGVYRK